MVHKGGIGAKSPQRGGCCDGTLGGVLILLSPVQWVGWCYRVIYGEGGMLILLLCFGVGDGLHNESL